MEVGDCVCGVTVYVCALGVTVCVGDSGCGGDCVCVCVCVCVCLCVYMD